jgi:hypothetical protein
MVSACVTFCAVCTCAMARCISRCLDNFMDMCTSEIATMSRYIKNINHRNNANCCQETTLGRDHFPPSHFFLGAFVGLARASTINYYKYNILLRHRNDQHMLPKNNHTLYISYWFQKSLTLLFLALRHENHENLLIRAAIQPSFSHMNAAKQSAEFSSSPSAEFSSSPSASFCWQRRRLHVRW